MNYRTFKSKFQIKKKKKMKDTIFNCLETSLSTVKAGVCLTNNLRVTNPNNKNKNFQASIGYTIYPPNYFITLLIHPPKFQLPLPYCKSPKSLFNIALCI